MTDKYIIKKNKLEQYLNLEISDEELFENIPDNINLAIVTEPEDKIYLNKYHIKNLLEKLINGSISLETAINFAETMTLTFLFDWDENTPDEEHEIVFNILHEIESMEEDETYQIEIFEDMLNEIKEIC